MLKGIDVSTVQGNIDWKKVAASGIDFAMIKASQGRGEGALTKHLKQFADPRFKKNITGAASAGIACGVYHYFTARTIADVDREAEFFIKTIKPYKDKIKLWAAVDVESKYILDLDKDTLSRLVDAFLARVLAAGYRIMLYTNPNFLTYKLNRADFMDVDTWLAHWGVSEPMHTPNMLIWQHGKGHVDGIETDVDLDNGYYTLPAYAEGDKYVIKAGDVYTNGVPVPSRLIGKAFTVMQVRADSILLREIMSWVKI